MSDNGKQNVVMATTGECVNGHKMPTESHFHSCPVCGERSVAIEPVFPAAMAPGARTIGEVLAAWKERGLRPVEITDGEQLQRITLTHDPLKGELKWETQGPLDGLMAIEMIANAALLMPAILTADGAFSISEYFTRGPGQLDLGAGEAAVMIGFKDGRMALDWTPKDAPVAAKKLLAAALLFMVARDAGLPIERILRAMGND